MARYEAWVITWIGHGALAVPTVPISAPIALLPSRSNAHRVEGAMEATLQQLSGSRVSDLLAARGRRRPDRVEWDRLGRSARIGHDPHVLALRARVLVSLRKRDPRTGEGAIVGYTYSKWATASELHDLALEMIREYKVDVVTAFASAEVALAKRTATWGRES